MKTVSLRCTFRKKSRRKKSLERISTTVLSCTCHQNSRKKLLPNPNVGTFERALNMSTWYLLTFWARRSGSSTSFKKTTWLTVDWFIHFFFPSKIWPRTVWILFWQIKCIVQKNGIHLAAHATLWPTWRQRLWKSIGRVSLFTWMHHWCTFDSLPSFSLLHISSSRMNSRH